MVKTSGFVVDQKLADEFNQAEFVPISVILKSPAKRRLSFEGTVTEVINMFYVYIFVGFVICNCITIYDTCI